MPKNTTKQQAKKKRIQFAFNSSHAQNVSLMGDFNQWDAKKHPMKKGSDGIWTKTIMLSPGTYEYKFMVDGSWQIDPQNANTCMNSFGTVNNIIKI